MSFQALTILLPCHSLEDFPVHHQGPEADNLLTAWTALWHPALIASAGTAPQWRRADDPPESLGGHLLAIPDVAVRDLPSGFLPRAKSEGAIVLRSGTREMMLALALEAAEGVDRLDGELVADFLALGYCFLQVELLTRQMRYASNLDEIHFRHQLVEGAQAAARGDESLAREKLASCFGMLSTERDHYYSVDVYLLDLTLVAETTLGPSLRGELDHGFPTNLLLTSELVARMAAEQPASLTRVREQLDAHRCALVGGERTSWRWPLLDVDTLSRNLVEGLQEYETQLAARPRIFGRHRSGLTPLIPQILHRLQFQSALHVAMDGGRIPQGSQFKTRWEGVDGTAIDAIARSPLDASEPGVFLGLCHKLGESMDMDHVASLCLAHWPGQSCRWYDELRRVTRHTSALGKFYLLDSYFRDTMLPGRLDRFEAGQYRCDFLKPAVIRREENPLSRVVDFWRNVAAQRAAEALQTWGTLLGAADEADVVPRAGSDEQPADPGQLTACVERQAQRLANALGKPETNARPRRVIFNPLPATRRVLVEQADSSQLSVEVPGWGFATVEPGAAAETSSSTRRKRAKLIADDLTLKNEHFEARVHSQTGGIASVRSFNSRSNLISQQLAMRLPRPAGHEPAGAEEPYTRMVAQTVKVVANSELRGVIESQGVLLDPEGSEAARFRQRTTVTAGDRVLRMHLELEPLREPRTDPWNSYYACRFAWGDDTAVITRSVQETRVKAEPGRWEAPLFVEIDNGHARVAVLTGGLPFHRLAEGRLLDNLLVARGESRREFTLGLAVDVPHPIVEACELLLPERELQVEARLPATVTSGWLFQVGVRNILATSWQPLVEQGTIRGFRVRLLETAGRATRSRLAAFRTIRSARQLDLLGSACGEFGVEEGQVQLQLGPNEWVEVEALF